MARTPGATNRTWREVEAEGRHLLEKAKLMKKNEQLKKAAEAARKAAKQAAEAKK